MENFTSLQLQGGFFFFFEKFYLIIILLWFEAFEENKVTSDCIVSYQRTWKSKLSVYEFCAEFFPSFDSYLE